MRLTAVSGALALVLSPVAAAGTLVHSDATVPACSSAQVARLRAVVDTQARIAVHDPDGHYIGWTEGDGIFWRNWEPVDAYKHTSCGRLDHYSFYNPWYSGDESDSNKYMVPAASFAYLITDAVAWGYSDAGAVYSCGGAQCMETEITHDESYSNNPWFPHVDNADSPLRGGQLCNYGPWIADHGHSGRPEIHPSEALWWSTAPTPSGVLQEARVLLLQDDSNRYDRRSDYTPDMPSNIKPWSGVPRTAFVRIAFELPRTGTQQEYLHVYEAPRRRNVTTASNAALVPDVTSGTQHTLVYGGVPKLTVIEHQPDDNLGVVFDDTAGSTTALHDLCRRADGYVQGYATLRSQFGVNDRGGEGYHELVIHRTAGATDPALANVSKSAAAPAPSPVQRVDLDWSTFRVERDGPSLRLRGDVMLSLRSDETLASIRDGEGRAVSTERGTAKSGAPQLRLRDLDLGQDTVLDLRFVGGAVDGGRLPGLALDSDLVLHRVESRTNSEAKALARAWQGWLASMHARPTPMPAQFAFTPRWRVEALPVFTPTKNGKPSREDRFHVAQRLNAAAAKGEATPLSIDDATQQVRWGRTQGVLQGADEQDRWSRTLRFDDPARLVEEQVHFSLEDAFGHRVEKQQAVASHHLVGSPESLVATLPELLAALSGHDTSTLFETPKADEDAIYDEASRHQRVLTQLVRRSASDGRVAPQELTRLLQLARRIGSANTDVQPAP